MRRLSLILLMLPVPVLADVVTPSAVEFTGVVAKPSPVCRATDAVTLASAAAASGFQRLDRLPPASEYLTVYRRVGDCPAPVIVRYNIGRSTAKP